MEFQPALDHLIVDLGEIPKHLRRELRPALRRAAGPILQDARRRASWSTRIPGAIRITTSFSGRRPGVRLVVDSRKAPHARPYEMGSKRSRNLRHPVFADPDEDREDWTWVNEPRRPFFFPSVNDGKPGVVAESNAAVLAAVRARGFL